MDTRNDILFVIFLSEKLASKSYSYIRGKRKFMYYLCIYVQTNRKE